MQNSKDSLKACFENVNIYLYTNFQHYFSTSFDTMLILKKGLCLKQTVGHNFFSDTVHAFVTSNFVTECLPKVKTSTRVKVQTFKKPELLKFKTPNTQYACKMITISN